MVHVYDRDMELTVSKEEEQCYIMAAKYFYWVSLGISKKISIFAFE